MTQNIDPIETARNNVLAAALALQKCTKTGGTRAEIPGTNNLIMVGPQEWIAKNVPGVEVMVAEPGAWTSLNDVQWMNIVNHEHAYNGYSIDEAVHEAVKRTEAKLKEINARLAATTQATPVNESREDMLVGATYALRAIAEGAADPAEVARAALRVIASLDVGATAQASTAQAEPTIPCCGDPECNACDRVPVKRAATSSTAQAERGIQYVLNAVRSFATTKDERDFARIERMVREYAATSSTDAQAEAEVRDAAHTNVWNDALTEVRVQVKAMQEAAYTFGDYSKEAVTTALDGVLDVIDELRSAGDTGEQSDGGAHA